MFIRLLANPTVAFNCHSAVPLRSCFLKFLQFSQMVVSLIVAEGCKLGALVSQVPLRH